MTKSASTSMPITVRNPRVSHVSVISLRFADVRFSFFRIGLEEQLPTFMLHPRVATITYLSDTGVPTLILNKRSPPPSDHDKKSLNGSINKAWLSHPHFGKHVAFDGRFLHGAPGKYFQSVNRNSLSVTEPTSKRLKVDVHGPNGVLSEKRITFLVNVSTNYRHFFTVSALSNWPFHFMSLYRYG